MNIDWNLILGVTITGLSIVFLALLLLIALIKIMGSIIVFAQKLCERRKTMLCEEINTITSENRAEDTISPEIAAVIAAAVAAQNPSEYPVEIKRSSSSSTSVFAWRQAGVLQNVQSFQKGVR